MNRLQAEFQRLYLPGPAPESGESGLIDADGRVRAMVLGLARPARCRRAVGAVARGAVRSGKPAPAIAVNGIDSYQLWFCCQSRCPWHRRWPFSMDCAGATWQILPQPA